MESLWGGIPSTMQKHSKLSPILPSPTVNGTMNVHRALVIAHYVYPFTLLFFFLGAITWWGIHTASKKPQTAWVPPSAAATARSSPARGRSPNGSTHGSDAESHTSGSESGGHEDDDDESISEISDAHRASRYGGPWYRMKERFAMWFRGELESRSKAGSAEKRVGLSPIRKAVLSWGFVIVIMTYIANSANIILHALVKAGWWCGQDVVISNVSLVFIWALILLSQLDTKQYPTVPHALAWCVALWFELFLFILNFINYSPSAQHHLSSFKVTLLSIDMIRIVILFALVSFYMFSVVFWADLDGKAGLRNDGEDARDDERAALLSNGRLRSKRKGYGATKEGETGKPSEPGWARRNMIARQSWWEYLRGYTVLFPYLWPSKSRWLQFLMVVCFILVMLQRLVNVLVPHQLGIVTDLLTEAAAAPVPPNEPPKSALSRIPWFQISLFILYRFLQGSTGVLGAVRSTLWIPIGQYSYQALSTSAFEHVHSLSLDFHLGKKTGEVLSALGKGSAINNFLEMVTFQVVPMLIDLTLAIGYFLVEFDAYYALIVAIVTLGYFYITVRMAQWRADIRREMTNKSREQDAVKNDSMIAYETVKYFNAEQYEFRRYRNAVKAFQRAEYQVLFSLNVMNVSQNLVFMVGLLVACYLSSYQVTTGQAKVGKFVSLLTYLAQLQGPLNFFGTFYRSIQNSMINSERMLELFKEKPTVVDAPYATPLKNCHGDIEFRNVHFSYDQRKPALKGLSFRATPGTTTAFVGESGGGKTTILRLLFRFYNAQEGEILIDGQNVQDIAIESLREKIAVVPQDTVLFNETVMYNLKYANPNATDEMVYEACLAARIHDKIMSFPDQYNTKVGERGLRLSGGEKQRVAIARAILKDPRVILLDEATAALDSETEQHIQNALKELSKGRTTLVIAHRLSTITSANQILCIHEGKVIERGTHEELLALNGRYATMWAKQVRAEAQKAMESGQRGQSQRTLTASHMLTDTPGDYQGLKSTDNRSVTLLSPNPPTTVGADTSPIGPSPDSQDEAGGISSSSSGVSGNIAGAPMTLETGESRLSTTDGSGLQRSEGK